MSRSSVPNWSLTLVDDQQDVEAFLYWIECLDGMVSIDTETHGLVWHQRDFVRLVTFADDHEGWAVPTTWWGRPLMQALASVRDRELPVAFWNASFDLKALAGDGFPVPQSHCVVDGMIQHALLFPLERHGLKAAASTMLGRWASIGEAQMKHEAAELGVKFWELPVDHESFWVYGILDTLLTQALVRKLTPMVSDAGLSEPYEREMQVSSIMTRAEMRGMRVDDRQAEATRREWLARSLRLKDHLQAHGIANPNSNRQLEDVFKSLGWTPEDFTDTGQAAMDRVVLGQLAELYPDIAPQIVEYKKLTKWIGSYLAPFAESGGRIHPNINTLRAKTGRMSITQPALQTLPSRGSGGEIRRCILPEAGHELWAIDYDGQEARIFANLSGDPGMAAAYAAGDDLYTHVARIVWDDPAIGRSDSRRSVAKVILLAFTYGAGAETLAVASGLSIPEVQSFLRKLFTEFPTVRDMTGDHAISGNHPGRPALLAAERLSSEGVAYVNTKGGRRFAMHDGEFYKAINGICQGSGSDVLKQAIVRLDRAGLSDSIVVPVHDEVVFSFPRGEGAELAADAAELMTDNDWRIPLTVDVTGPLTNWGESYV